VPAVNLDAHLHAPNVNMVTCAGQATVPIVHAIARVSPVVRAEIVVWIAAASAGPATRANLDQLIATTARALEQLGGVQHAAARIVLDRAAPPAPMRASISCELETGAQRSAILDSVRAMLAEVAIYAPRYRLRAPPQFAGARVIVELEIEGTGDFLARYSGNLDIITAAAARVGELIARTALSTIDRRSAATPWLGEQ
jgi:acetaldehyde dehydrogenase